MTATRFDIGTFDGKGNFGSWKKKMTVLLSHHKVFIALEPNDRKWTGDQLARTNELREETFNLIFLHLGDSVIRKVDGTKKHGLYVLNGCSLYPISSAYIAKSDTSDLVT